MKHYLLMLFVSAFATLVGCVPKQESAQLQSKVDSLQYELETARKAVTVLQEVGALMDSVDAARNDLSMDMEVGTNYEDYKTRMENIQSYIRQTEQKLDALQGELEKSDANRNAYTGTVKKLRRDLAARNKEVQSLQDQVVGYKSENQDLITTLNLKSDELEKKEQEIALRKEELALIEARIEELRKTSKTTEADAYYARAEAMEEVANRTKLAPKKKKESYKEALTLYQESLVLGRIDAQDKIDALTKKI
ncbi:hypothetical protein FNH22_14860 [Fulvivirga sp. M361]|uniref:hypothetical protein n=1 Tax=Fulvivirga sp. M361 TaxID=2594266 RepID=UPI00117B7C88|nr:hypothetical protein [Fulvivirga sp. M361]TRX57690.1 hypothetical protein FNH22_14860 [Fulvivirga sp. M361]